MVFLVFGERNKKEATKLRITTIGHEARSTIQTMKKIDAK